MGIRENFRAKKEEAAQKSRFEAMLKESKDPGEAALTKLKESFTIYLAPAGATDWESAISKRSRRRLSFTFDSETGLFKSDFDSFEIDGSKGRALPKSALVRLFDPETPGQNGIIRQNNSLQISCNGKDLNPEGVVKQVKANTNTRPSFMFKGDLSRWPAE